MSLIDKLFNKNKNRYDAKKDLELFDIKMRPLLEKDTYIAKSDYNNMVKRFSKLYEQFKALYESDLLSSFCEKNNISIKNAEIFLTQYKDLNESDNPKVINAHNEEYVNNHLKKDRDYLDNILSAIDKNIKLDDEQRKVVLSDEDYTLVIAGAGAGKTTTVAAKVKYLVDKKSIKPEEILVISFTNKAVGELKDKINKRLKINCPVTTFHKTGYAILRKQDDQPKTIVDQGFMYDVINNYLKEILKDSKWVDKLILFFGSYFDAPFEGKNLNDFFNYIKKADFSTLRGNMSEYAEKIIDKRTGKHISIAYESLRSSEEVRIANFLYMNGIDYSYEEPYQFNIENSFKPYTPDFTISQEDKIAYLEHFGITEDGKNDRYRKEQLDNYKKHIDDKIALHNHHKTDLIYTFSSYKDGRDLLDHLKEELVHLNFKLEPRSAQEVFEKIVNTEENKYISGLVKLVCTFIQNFKTNGFQLDDFKNFRDESNNERTKLFLTICKQCYLEYTKCLSEKNAIDFEDMINDSARILRNEAFNGRKLNFKYIIVDEYQDISRQRFDLTKELSKLCTAKIIAVGDDWQSIYAYAGSDITLFTHFKETFGYGLELRITKTYRNAQEVIDIAGGFIQKNRSQISKSLKSPKHINNPVIIQTYTEEFDRKEYNGRGGKYFLIGKTVQSIVSEILKENPKSSILLLGRYGFDGFNLTKSADFIYLEKKGIVTSKTFAQIQMEYMTVHRAKGLGFDNVIIINAIDSLYGFPSKVQDDPILKYVVKDDQTIEYAEERRLFYVALTRTKNRVYIVTPQQRPSEFVRELVNDYQNVLLRGELDEKHDYMTDAKLCPVCGYPLQLRYKKTYGLRLWICSNEPEICDFMTNDLRGGDLPILKCDKCKDGYLIVKPGKKEPFLGCSNYKADRTGCDRFMTKEYYKEYVLNKKK